METYAFQAEINQLMSLIINAFYSNKEIFLRELISNASDAIDKYHYQSLQSGNVPTDERKIRIIADKVANTLTIEDNGIGMTKDDLIQNLGTIARSGTKAFMESMTDKTKDVSLIGQFGVGFYSAYLVADEVRVISKNEADGAYEWSSVAGGSFTIRALESELVRGTRIILKLKEDQVEYLEEGRLREVVKKHNSFLQIPIELQVEMEVDVPIHEETIEKETVDGTVEEATDEVKPKTKKEKCLRWDVLNTQKPIWLQKPDDVTKEQHNEFYKSISNDYDDPLAVKHFKVEGQLEFSSVLYCPKRAPFDMFSANKEKKSNLKLYVRRVFINDKKEDLLPEWLNFIQGVVDSDDLPLNVSREMLQQNRAMKVIQKNVIKKCIEMLQELSSDDFDVFYKEFAKNLKLGVCEEETLRPKLIELIRFNSSTQGEYLTSIKEYVGRAKEGQTKIFYISGESLKHVKNSPFLEKLRKGGYEVLFMVDPIDEYMMQRVTEYKCDDKTYQFCCITKDGELLDEKEEDRSEEFKTLCETIMDVVGKDILEKVSLSTRISDTPAVLVTSKYGWSANMTRIMKAQALHNNSMMPMMNGKKNMEINPDNVIIKGIKERIETNKEDPTIKNLIQLLYDTAYLASGFQMEDPNTFVKRIHRMMQLGMDIDEPEEEVHVHTHECCHHEEETKMEEVD